MDLPYELWIVIFLKSGFSFVRLFFVSSCLNLSNYGTLFFLFLIFHTYDWPFINNSVRL